MAYYSEEFMEEIRRYVNNEVMPLLESMMDKVDCVVEVAISVVNEVLKILGHEKYCHVEHVVRDCFHAIVRKTNELSAWIVLALNKGLAAVRTHLENHPILTELKEPIGRLAAKCVLLLSGKLALNKGTVLAARFGTKQTAKLAPKICVAALSIAGNSGGMVADLAQAGFELAGMQKAGKAVGAVGNITSGAMIGMMVGGPLGAVGGAAVSGAVWGFGELVGKLMSK